MNIEEVRSTLQSWLTWDDWNDKQRETIKTAMIYLSKLEKTKNIIEDEHITKDEIVNKISKLYPN